MSAVAATFDVLGRDEKAVGEPSSDCSVVMKDVVYRVRLGSLRPKRPHWRLLQMLLLLRTGSGRRRKLALADLPETSVVDEEAF